MGWKVTISPGAIDDPDAFTVDAKFRFDLQGHVKDNEQGKVEYIEWHIEVDGDIVRSTASDVADSLLATMDQLKQYTPRNVYLSLDGVTKYTWTSSTCVGSPRIIAFKTQEEDGNADSHWRYSFTIYVKEGGNIGNGVTDIQTSLLIVTEGKQVIKKVWRAFARGTSVAKAMALVLTFKPSDQTTHEEIERFFQDNSVKASWTWELIKNYTVIEEPIVITGNGKSWVWDYAISDGGNPPPPIIHRAANEITKIKIKGIVRGNDPDKLAPPQAHYNDNGNTLTRNEAEEEKYFPGIDDPIKGIWALPYTEVWLFTGTGPIPKPNHSNHSKPVLLAPADGAIGA